METFHITDVISLLNLPAPPSGRGAYYVQCPCCAEGPRKRHLNINLKKDVFRCPRCGVSGGIFDLYSLYTGVPRGDVRQALIDRIGMPENAQKRRTIKYVPPTVHEYPITDIDTRHATYSALLDKLTLAPDHREDLLARGLTDEEIGRLGYKSMPVTGFTAIAKQLQEEGHYLAGVPGFFRKKDGDWTFVYERRGILVPARDRNGAIQGLQVRFDKEKTPDDSQKQAAGGDLTRKKKKERKFRWISSVERQDGCPAKCWTHLAGPVQETILLTEGPMKADVIHELSGKTVLAVPGVNSLEQLSLALSALKAEGLQEIKTAFDMDFSTNQHVQSGYHQLLSLLGSMGFRYGVYLWDPRYKGLDDYIWDCCLEGRRA